MEGVIQGFLAVYELTEGNRFITARTYSTRTNLSHEVSTLTLLLAKQAHVTDRTLIDGVGLSGL